MKALIITCFESNEERALCVYNTCLSLGIKAKIISTNFSHIGKRTRLDNTKCIEMLNTKPYTSNLSIARIKSHIYFSKDAFELAEKENPDLIWLMAPANSLIKQAKEYKKKHTTTKLIIDIIDMWPESLPINISKNIPPLSIWRSIRSKNLNCADALVTECDFYQNILAKEYKKSIHTIRWCRDDKVNKLRPRLPKDKLSLVYIGSINNIISSQLITQMIKNTDKPVVLHIIGEGENRYNFVNVASRYCEVVYHGPIRDEKKKAEIFSECHAGINIYRNNLYIGLTVKCIDYFEHGLPIINNIKGDTWSMVDRYGVGINIDKNTKIDADKLINIRKNNDFIYDFYNDNFTKEVFANKCLEVIDEVLR